MIVNNRLHGILEWFRFQRQRLLSSALGAKFGYYEGFFHEDCDQLIPLVQINEIGQPMGTHFSICSWNVFGLLKYTEHFMKWSIWKRITKVIETIIEQDLDLICLQEISTPVFQLLHEQLHDRYFFYEPTINTEQTQHTYHRNLEVLFLTRKKPKSFINYRLGGNLGYSNNLCVLEFPDLVVLGCYLQAGSKHSMGQENNWFHYSRCRQEQLEVVRRESMRYPQKAQIILGDFNFHLDGNPTEWPETQQLGKLKSLGFIDSYRSLFPDQSGWTEDTDRNYFRYNSKFLEKRFRYDGILSKGLRPIDSIILGTEQIDLTDDEIAEMIDVCCL